MALAVVGNVTPEQVLAVCDRCLKPAADVTVERAFLPEPREIVQDYQACHLATSIPVFSFGYKACTKPEQDIETIILTNLLLEIMAGDSSPLYKDLFDRGLISSEFSTEYFHGHGYEAIIFDGESTDPGRWRPPFRQRQNACAGREFRRICTRQPCASLMVGK